MKICTQCHTAKPRSGFYRNPGNTLGDGLRGNCKKCCEPPKTPCPQCGGEKQKKSTICVRCLNKRSDLNRMTEGEVGWVAGLLEGEGSWTRHRNNRTYISVQMTDQDIINRLHLVTGVGTTFFTKRKKPHHKDSWRWQVAAQAQVASLTEAVLPWMGKRRSGRIAELMGS